MLDILWTHVLKRLEAFPDATFRESDLIGVSKQLFDQMSRDGFLEFDRYDGDGDTYFSDRMGERGIERTIRVRNDKITAFSVESDVATLELTKPETTYYRFNLNKLIDQIRTKNKLEEQVDSVEERLTFIGSLDVSGVRAGFFLGLFDSQDELAKNLIGLPNKTSRYTQYIVLSPFNRIGSQEVQCKLSGINISHLVFDDTFDQGFIFKLGLAFKAVKNGLPQMMVLTGLTSGNGRLRRHIIKIDDKEGTLSEECFVVLSRFVVAFKTEKDRYAQVSKLVEEGVFNSDTTHWQKVKRLKDSMFQEFSGFNFDEVFDNGQGCYRLVISEIDYDLKELKKIKGNGKIEAIVNKLPSGRRKKK